jgi:hypothetical protein
MSLQIKGTVIQVLKPESGVSKAGKEWRKQDFVIETQEQFPKKVCFTLFNDKAELLNNIGPGNEVEVSFSVESRDFNGKWYHNLNAWKVELANSAPQSYAPEFTMDDIPPEPAGSDFGSDLPF